MLRITCVPGWAGVNAQQWRRVSAGPAPEKGTPVWLGACLHCTLHLLQVTFMDNTQTC